MKKCKKLGWKIGEYRDFIKYKDEYYTFIWIRKSDKRIKEILTSDRRSIFENGKYKVGRITYRGLIFQDSPPKDIVQMIDNDLDLSKRIAIYDFTKLFGGKNVCETLNKTNNTVFSEFERFLSRDLKAVLKPLKL